VHRSFVPLAALGVVILTASALAATPSPAPAPAPAPYTAAQAAQGAKLFAAHCSECHGAKLQGVSAPSLLSADLPGSPKVSDVYAILSTQMPADAPGSLKPTEYAAITAFLLKTNHHPASGTDALTDATAKTLPIAY
jgi:mono/diheme cytochrome c family protein